MGEVKKLGSENRQSIEVNGVPIVWKENNQGFTFFGIDSVLFWCRPSLVTILQPLQEEIGETLYSRLITFEASKGTYEDYHLMVNGVNFEDGFHTWSNAVTACGWGSLYIEKIDWEKKTALIRIENPWELKIFRAKNLENEIPFLRGKISGVFTHAFATNCVSRVILATAGQGSNVTVMMQVEASTQTLEQALLEVNTTQGAEEKVQLRAANNALRRNERRLLDVIDTVGDFIWESDRNLKLTYATGQASRALKVSEELLIGKPLSELMDALEYTRLLNLLGEISIESPFAEGEFQLLTPAGENLCIHLRVKRLYDFSQNHQGYVGSGRDITQEKILESKFVEHQKNAQFTAKMATLGEMAAGVAHEINTPLAVISLLAEQLTLDPQKNEAVLTAANTILETSERIAKIIQGLKTFAREAPQDDSRIESLNKIIEETLSLCHARFKNSEIEIRIPKDQKDFQVLCRSTQIMQVLLNLLNNAFDAVTDLDEKWVKLSAETKNDTLEIQVMDSGQGIAAEIHQKLMQPFFSTKPVGKGTGLGLSISKGIIESHGGSLYYQTRSGQTCFVIELPNHPISKV